MSAQLPKFSVTILGSNSALPAFGRNPTSQLLNANHHYYLIDCGEGTQMQLRKYAVKMQRIRVMFISHMHGDHYFGIAGLLNSMQLLGRNLPLDIYAPPELEKIVRLQLDASGGRLQYPLTFHAIEPFEGIKLLYEDKHVTVEAFMLKHRIPCYGFRFTEQQKEFTYLPEKGGRLGVRVEDIPTLKSGHDVELPDGRILKYADVTIPPPEPRSYVYCTDTLPLDSTAEHARGCNCLYHEATFLEAEAERSKSTFHSTAKEAATVAKHADAKQLLIGHFSARYEGLEAHLEEACSIFSNTALAIEGKTFEIL